jgi:serine-type D-Ala-D-Ala carboxypeptidase/endopeptidase (penicillin-binding protein 4)
MPRLRLIRSTIFLLPAFLAGPVSASEKSLAAKIEEVTNSDAYKSAHWGILIGDQNGERTLYEHDGGKLFAPASVTKLYSVATALDTFGSAARFDTSVYRQGDVDASGRLNGNLILVAGGDFMLGGRTSNAGEVVFTDVDHTYANDFSAHAWTEADPLAGLNELSRQIAASGIKQVEGDVVIDDRLFEKTKGDSGASGPSTITPIMVNDNVIDILVTPAKAGSLATIDWRPKSAAINVDARVETVERGNDTRIEVTAATRRRRAAANGAQLRNASEVFGFLVRGQIAEGEKPLLRMAEVNDPAAFARTLLIEALQRAGIVIVPPTASANLAGRLPDPESYKPDHRVANLTSLPFSEEAKLILKVSHNLHAGALPLLVAVKHGQRTLAEGLHLQHDFLVRAHVDVDTISFSDGVGGSRGDATTPRATVQLLRYMATRPDFAAYEAALPVLGVDGTLASAVGLNSPARGRVRAKSGTLFWENTMNRKFLLPSKALAGYLTTTNGQKLVFAFFVNNVLLEKATDTSRVGATLGRLCEIVCEEQ